MLVVCSVFKVLLTRRNVKKIKTEKKKQMQAATLNTPRPVAEYEQRKCFLFFQIILNKKMGRGIGRGLGLPSQEFQPGRCGTQFSLKNIIVFENVHEHK